MQTNRSNAASSEAVVDGNELGFIGLGNMGKPMARAIARKGHAMVVHDIAGTAERAPQGAVVAQSNAEVARRAGVIALSLPSVESNRRVVQEIAEAGHGARVVVDTCTIGPEAAAENARILAAVGIDYLDSPVSGMVARAESGTLTTMVSGSSEALNKARVLIDGYSATVFHVGTTPGQGQRMKLVNNSLYISNLVTVCEALGYGEDGGLSLETMLSVLNASSGSSFVSREVFPKHITATSPMPSGVPAHILNKDFALFTESVRSAKTPCSALREAQPAIAAFADNDPQQEMGNIYRFLNAWWGK